MARTLEFYFDYGSPYSYLADTQVEAIAKRTGAALVRKPMLLGGVFKATGNASPMTVALKSKWSAFDMPMWAHHYGVPFNRNPHFPVNTLTLMRGAAAAQIDGLFERYHPAIYRAMGSLAFAAALPAQTFIQMSDPQFGMFTKDVDFAHETANLEFAIAAANRLKPEFVVIFPWNLRSEITEQLNYIRDWGGQFVTAVPALALS